MGGIFGTISRADCVTDLFYGTDYHSHLGTKRAGMCVYDRGEFIRSIHSIEDSYFRTKFEQDLPKFRGNMGIGVISDTDNQPILIHSHLGRYAVVTVGKILNMDELEKRMLKQHRHFSETTQAGTNPSEMVAMLMDEEKNFADGIENVRERIRGSCTFMVLTPEGIYAARDRLGRTPLAIGRKNGSRAVASETSAFPTLGYELEYQLGPNELVFISPEEYKRVIPPGSRMQVCAFLWVYYGYPAAEYEGVGVEPTRYRCGAELARKDDTEADLVSGIPDSGVGHAIGYAMEKRIPYMRPYVKYTPTWPRSFMPSRQETRELVARMKLIPVREVIEGKRIVFCDDSIVRGTQLLDTIRVLKHYGAKETHMRVACPPLVYACDFLNFSASKSVAELASRKAMLKLEGRADGDAREYATAGTSKYQAMVEEIRKRIGLTTLVYQNLDDLVMAIGLPKVKICTHCFDGSSFDR
ncbi:MAG TPA: amidophosphoribosyltransferase [Bacteroidetes bacterium]|nr:amidophosphoribosyltransferase [Bacteroidota bacterium]